MAFPTESIPASQPIPESRPAGVRKQYSPSDLLAVVKELAELMESAKPFLITKDIRINRDSALALVNELREALPVAVENADAALVQARNQLVASNQQAQTLMADAKAQADGVLASAQAEAEALMAQTRQHQRELVDQEAVVSQAKVRAAEIVNAAQAEAEHLMTDADAYVNSSLAELARELDGLSHQVAAGRARLAERHPQIVAQTQVAPQPQPAPKGRR